MISIRPDCGILPSAICSSKKPHSCAIVSTSASILISGNTGKSEIGPGTSSISVIIPASVVFVLKHSSHSSSTGGSSTTTTVLLLLFIHTNLKSPSERDCPPP